MTGRWRHDDVDGRYAAQRAVMVEQQLADRGISAPLVLAAMRAVPRHAFIRLRDRGMAYSDRALPLGHGQTISQPYIVALTLQALRLQPDHNVLEIGTGSGYCAACLGHVCRQVHSVERLAPLAEQAAGVLAEQGLHNVEVHVGDGTLGWPEAAPYDAIAVSAGGPRVPEALVEQLAPGGRLVMPVGPHRSVQELVLVELSRTGAVRRESLGDVRFVPLIGAQGWED